MRIVCAWELGSNLGHTARLATIARELSAQGHIVTVVLRDLSTAAGFFERQEVALLQAPVYLPKLKMNREFASLADVLTLYGFLTRDSLWGLSRAWQSLFTLARADLLIADHAPSALVGAQLLQLPRILIGNGFTLPEAGEPLLDWRPLKVQDSLVETQEQAVLAVINQVLPKAQGLARLSELYRCHQVLINSFPLLDSYANVRKHVVYRADNPQRLTDQLVFSGHHGVRIACYLSPACKKLKELCAAFARFPAEFKIVCPGADMSAFAGLAAPNVTFTTELTDMESLIAGCDWFVCHGGLGSSTQCLRLGKPLLILPLQLEQLNTGVLLQKAQLARIIPELETSGHYLEALRHAVSDSHAGERARRFALDNRGYCQQTFAAAVSAAVARLNI